MDRRFKIDIFELSFLAEACIPTRPIARSMFWNDMIDVYYHEMSLEESGRLHEWISKNYSYKENIEKGDEDTLIFDARYDPKNQYEITTVYEGKTTSQMTFLYKGRYYTKKHISILKEYITKIENVR